VFLLIQGSIAVNDMELVHSGNGRGDRSRKDDWN